MLRIKQIIYEIIESDVFNEYRIKRNYDRIIESNEINGIESNEGMHDKIIESNKVVHFSSLH